jgi:hypothetical protein
LFDIITKLTGSITDVELRQGSELVLSRMILFELLDSGPEVALS